ncbi:integrase arm-type DNA-binding domain-containing protein [Colwellia sp. MB02u-14]|uniref:integrase arm-type DNA-binding domain-containing protein n=1 Tax=Colwellia sp. MB02u-14 TaxID=2759815 RepID=UPI0015F63EB1|nr:integrase arm-type DNA-binding domain-containing protein [Colwellia sp. MB02u-14]MBA6304386.1 integrase arm-type DNA-binding domain-containing protein [Colwellia sp. MB02u-14]
MAKITKPHGSKFWLFTYLRPISKKRANLSLGKYPALSLADARRLREEARSLLANDIDPKEEKDKQQREKLLAINSTLRVVVAQWFAIKKRR